jgi:hypothetical protein
MRGCSPGSRGDAAMRQSFPVSVVRSCAETCASAAAVASVAEATPNGVTRVRERVRRAAPARRSRPVTRMARRRQRRVRACFSNTPCRMIVRNSRSTLIR